MDKFRFTQNANFAKKQTRQYIWNSSITKHILGIERGKHYRAQLSAFDLEVKKSFLTVIVVENK